jgi:hypothetical protein
VGVAVGVLVGSGVAVGVLVGVLAVVLALPPLAARRKGVRMNEQLAMKLTQCLLEYGQAIAHRAALETAALVDGQRPYAPHAADMLLRRAAQALAAALREVSDAR